MQRLHPELSRLEQDVLAGDVLALLTNYLQRQEPGSGLAEALELTIGHRVRYVLTAEDAARVNFWRDGTADARHVGSLMIEGDVVALDVTRVLSVDQINGRALLDGNDVLWVTGVLEGAGEPGTWHWPSLANSVGRGR